MLSYKSLTLLTIAVLGFADTSEAAKCITDKKDLRILLQEPDIWVPDGDYIRTKLRGADALPAGLPADTFTDATWKSFRDDVEYTLSTEKCVKTTFNDKSIWENVYQGPMQSIILRLRTNGVLNHLEFDKLTDLACKELVFRAGYSGEKAYGDLQPNQFRNFRAGCWPFTNAVGAVACVKHWSSDLIKQIPAPAFNDSLASNFIIHPMKDEAGDSVFSKMTPDQVKQYISDPNRCTKLTRAHVLSNPHAKVYTNACLLKVPGLFGAIEGEEPIKQMTTFLKNLDSQAFSTLPEIDASVAALIPASLAKGFDSDDATEFRCTTAPLDALTPVALASVVKECMAGWVTNSVAETLVLTNKIAKLPGTIFSGIPNGDTASFKRLIHEKNIPYFTTEHWKLFLADPANCNFIQDVPKVEGGAPKFEWSRLPVITAECVFYMKDGVFATMATSNVGIKKFDERVLTSATKESISVETLDAIAKNRIGLLKHLGTSVPIDASHPCRHFSVEQYKDKDKKNIHKILNNSNKTCILSIDGLEALEKEDASEDLFKNLPRALFAVMDIENLRAHKHLPTNFWSTLGPFELEVLLTPSNCTQLDSALLVQINPEAFSAFHYECLVDLKGDLSVPQLAKVPKDVFAQVDSATLPKLKNLQGATNEQLAALSTKVADPKKHAGSAFSDATIAGLSPAQVGALNVGTVGALPDSAWKGFDPERFKALRPEVLTKATCSQFKQLPKESWYEITVAQAIRAGEAVSKPEDSPRCVYTKEVLALVKDRHAAKIISGASQLVVSMALVAVSMVLGLWLA